MNSYPGAPWPIWHYVTVDRNYRVKVFGVPRWMQIQFMQMPIRRSDALLFTGKECT